MSVWSRMSLLDGDITRLDVDVIVNAANTTLLGGGGVDGAIHRAAGPELLSECRAVGGCPTGQARITRGYRLKARHVIHTVGPVFAGGGRGEPELLRSCYESSLKLALDHELGSIAFPAISCGVYGYPAEAAAAVAFETTAGWLERHATPREVRFVLFDPPTRAAYGRVWFRLRAAAGADESATR